MRSFTEEAPPLPEIVLDGRIPAQMIRDVKVAALRYGASVPAVDAVQLVKIAGGRLAPVVDAIAHLGDRGATKELSFERVVDEMNAAFRRQNRNGVRR